MAKDSNLCHGWAMRKTVHALALPVALLLALGLSACNGGQVPVSKSTGSDETTTSARADSSQEPTERPTTGRPSGRPTTGRPSERPTTERPTTETPTAKGRTVQATDLQVGDCYNEPDPASATTNDDGKRQVGSVEVVDCEVPHQHEVYSTYTITSSTFPSDDDMKTEVYNACYDSFTSYVGVDVDSSSYGTLTYTPTSISWNFGNHQITCAVSPNKDDNDTTSTMTGSVKDTAK